MQRRTVQVLIFMSALFLIFSPTLMSTAQSDTESIVVGVRHDSLLMVVDGETETVIEQNADHIYYPLEASGRGDVLYISSTDDRVIQFEGSLHIFDGENTRHITDDFATEYPPYFEDADHVIYVSTQIIETFNNDEGQASFVSVPVLRYDLITDTTEQISIALRFFGGGGGGSSGVAMDHVLEAEYLSSGSSSLPDFFDADLLHFEHGPIVAISADHRFVLTLSQDNDGYTINMVTVTPQSVTPLLQLDQLYDSIYWATDGDIYYSTSSDLAPTYPLLTDAESDELRGHLKSHQEQVNWRYERKKTIPK